MILSITGADNLTKISDLHNFHENNPHVELGILYYLEKQGTHRNPTFDWRKMFFEQIGSHNVSYHLCGEEVFRSIIDTNFETTLIFNEFKQASRLQLNINARKDLFNHNEIHQIYSKLVNLGFRIILQYNEHSKSWILPFLDANINFHNQIDILLDSSLGKGVVITEFYIPEELNKYHFKYGFAGGISSENIQNIHEKIKQLNVEYWLDLESGARIDNIFNMDKAILLANYMK